MQNHSVGKPWCFAHERLEQLQGLGQVYIQECRTDLGWGIYRGVIQTWARMGTRVSFSLGWDNYVQGEDKVEKYTW